jgi:S1-C subfamily serine protease
MTSRPGSTNTLLAAIVVLLAVAAGAVGAHFLWSATNTPKPRESANRGSGPARFPSGGGFSEHCNSSGCSFNFNGGSFSNGNFGNAFGPSSGGGNVASSITSKVDPALVDINTQLGYLNGAAAGTGMVVTPGGEVITNNHVIVGATKITAFDVGNGKTYTARVVGYDRGHDIAVLQLLNASGLKTVTLGNSSSLRVGEHIATIGNAGGAGGTPSAATGQISALGRSITAADSGDGTAEHLQGLIQLNGDLQPGDSGGPLVTSSGVVVGLDTAASSTFVFESASGAGFAIPIDQVHTIAGSIVNGTVTDQIHLGSTPFLGVTIASRSSARGATVLQVLSGTPAAGTGLASGDVIKAVDGTAVTSPGALTEAILRHQAGSQIQITWQKRSGSQQTAKVTLTSGPPQ